MTGLKGYRNHLMRPKEEENSHLQRKDDIIYNENLIKSVGTFHFKACIYNLFPYNIDKMHKYHPS